MNTAEYISAAAVIVSFFSMLVGALGAYMAWDARQSSKSNAVAIKEVKEQTDGVAAKMQELGEVIGEKRGRKEKGEEMRDAREHAELMVTSRMINEQQIVKALEDAREKIEAVDTVPVLAPVDPEQPKGEVKVVEALTPKTKKDHD